MKYLVLGKSGQLGRAISRILYGNRKVDVVQLGRPELDVRNLDALSRKILNISPSVIINTTAYTDVEGAEKSRYEAYRVNAEALGTVGLAAAQINSPVIHVSTDYVFDGVKRTPYHTFDETNPRSVYGASKLAGEIALATALTRHVIIRTAWLYGSGRGNFVDTMLRMSEKKKRLSIVDDQIGCPTNVDDLANAILSIANRVTSSNADAWGVFHYCGSGDVSWYGFAQEIFAQAAHFGWSKPQLIPTKTDLLHYKAPRPSYSVLDCSRTLEAFGVEQKYWRRSLRNVVRQKLCPIENLGG